jgi:thiamine-monophosphate kinase
MPSEFSLIDRYFRRPTRHTVLGVGDDGALIRPAAGCELVVSTDMLVAGTHFYPDAAPEDLGWKVLAVNVSDMAAMGAQPKWALLAAALPAATELWIEKFAAGFFACADAFGIDVIGGDTTKSPPVEAASLPPPPGGQENAWGGPARFPGPRVFCVTIFGEVPEGEALLRSGAQAGDEVWVSGTPGRAALGLAHLQGRVQLREQVLTNCLAALHRPQPRVALGLKLRGLATATIDVSDGLLADLGHILQASGLAATLRISVPSASTFGIDAQALVQDCFLAGGDDYELVFTAPAHHHEEVLTLGKMLDLPLTCLGACAVGTPGAITTQDAAGLPIDVARRGYDHFAA